MSSDLYEIKGRIQSRIAQNEQETTYLQEKLLLVTQAEGFAHELGVVGSSSSEPMSHTSTWVPQQQSPEPPQQPSPQPPQPRVEAEAEELLAQTHEFAATFQPEEIQAASTEPQEAAAGAEQESVEASAEQEPVEATAQTQTLEAGVETEEIENTAEVAASPQAETTASERKSKNDALDSLKDKLAMAAQEDSTRSPFLTLGKFLRSAE